MKQHLNIEILGSHGKGIQDRPAVAAATANISIAKADYRKLTKKDEASKFEAELETEPRKSELVVLWLFIAVLVTLTVFASYMLWKKVS